MADVALAGTRSATGSILDRDMTNRDLTDSDMTDAAHGPSSGVPTGYLVQPESGAEIGVVLIGDTGGLTGHLRSVADRFVAAGIAAFAPALQDVDLRSARSGGADRDATDVRALGASVAQAAGAALADRRKIAFVGFGIGAAVAISAAAEIAGSPAVVAFYPGLPKNWAPLTPGALTGSGVLVHAPATVDLTSGGPGAFTAAVSAAGGSTQVRDYPDVDRDSSTTTASSRTTAAPPPPPGREP